MRSNKLEKIITISTELMISKGYHGTSLQEIADKVGIHKTTLFHYIKNKEDLLFRILATYGKRLNKNLNEIIKYDSLEPKEQLYKAIECHVFSVVNDVRGLGIDSKQLKGLPTKNIKTYEQLKHSYETKFSTIIVRLKEKGYFSDIDAKIVASSLIAMMNSVPKWYKFYPNLSLEEISDKLYRIITGGHLQRNLAGPKRS